MYVRRMLMVMVESPLGNLDEDSIDILSIFIHESSAVAGVRDLQEYAKIFGCGCVQVRGELLSPWLASIFFWAQRRNDIGVGVPCTCGLSLLNVDGLVLAYVLWDSC